MGHLWRVLFSSKAAIPGSPSYFTYTRKILKLPCALTPIYSLRVSVKNPCTWGQQLRETFWDYSTGLSILRCPPPGQAVPLWTASGIPGAVVWEGFREHSLQAPLDGQLAEADNTLCWGI